MKDLAGKQPFFLQHCYLHPQLLAQGQQESCHGLFFSGSGLGDIPHLSLDGWIGVIFLGVFCSGLAYIAWYDALNVLPTGQLGSFLFLEPPVAVIVAALILSEVITWAARKVTGWKRDKSAFTKSCIVFKISVSP